MSNDKSEPAFPVPGSEYGGTGTFFGMSMRDYFAAKAMQGICAHPETWGQGVDGLAESAYDVADAMLAARNAGD